MLFQTDTNNVMGKFVEEAGDYNVVISRSELRTSQKNNQYISLDYKVLDGTYQGAEIKFQNITWDDSTQESLDKSVRRFNTILAAIGVPSGTRIESLQQLAQSLLNKRLSITVEWDSPNDKGAIYLTVRGYNNIDPNGSQPNGQHRPESGNRQNGNNGFGQTQSRPQTQNGFGGFNPAPQPRHIDPTAPIEQPAANGGFGNTAPKQANPDPFANNNGQPIDISDDDLPF